LQVKSDYISATLAKSCQGLFEQPHLQKVARDFLECYTLLESESEAKNEKL